MKPVLRVLAALCLLSNGLPLIAANPFDLPEKINQTLQQTFEALFDEDFKQADALLKSLKEQNSRHPVISLASVVRVWWKMSLAVMETDEQFSRSFLEVCETSRELARQKIEEGDKKGEGTFVMATVLGLMSRWSVANHAWIAAYFRGARAAELSERALRKNPQLHDAFLTLGTFNYANNVIQGYVEKEGISTKKRFFKTDGLAQLRKAYEKGTYFKLPAGVLLAGLLTNLKPKEALPLLCELRYQLPQSAFIQVIYITALYNIGDELFLTEEVDEFSKKIEAGLYPKSYIPQAYFVRALVYFRKKSWKKAEEQFELAIKNGNEENPYYTWALLYKGYVLDALGHRRRAKNYYQRVMGLKRRFASHDHAKNRLQKPFKPDDPELKKLEL